MQERFEAGSFLYRTGRLDEAADCYRSLLREAPHVAKVHYNLGLVLRTQGHFEAAVQNIREALRLQPDLAEAHVNLANTIYQLGHLEEAETACREALRLAPHLAQAHSNLGNILRDQGRFEDSAAAFRLALQRWPDDHDLHNNLGNTLKALGRLEEAETAYQMALRQQPDSPGTLYNLSTLHLTAGRFTEGWQGYEHRWRTGAQGIRPFGGPLWDGQGAPSDRVLLYTEQGIGDTIQFCRYVPLVAERIQVTLVIKPEFKRLFADLHPNVTIIGADEALPDYAFQCPLQSVPLAFRTTLGTIPANTPYLRAQPLAVARWRERLAALQGLRVGLVWAGNPANSVDRRRSVDCGILARLFARPGLAFVSLQKGAASAPPVGSGLHDWTAGLKDLADTAALIEALDLVIGVDTAVIHLAGALGKPTWLLNRFDTDWRWLLDREDSPWYPTMRLFRQERPGDWNGVVNRVSMALDEILRAVGPAEATTLKP
jgi:Tfp pilus assembly protein PilF